MIFAVFWIDELTYILNSLVIAEIILLKKNYLCKISQNCEKTKFLEGQERIRITGEKQSAFFFLKKYKDENSGIKVRISCLSSVALVLFHA